LVEDPFGHRLVGRAAEHHRAEAQGRDSKGAAAEIAVVHACSCFLPPYSSAFRGQGPYAVAAPRTNHYVRRMKIAIAADHAALEMKADLVEWLGEQGHEALDLGPHGPGSVDYPDYGYKLAEAIASGAAERGIALCGSGI